jgi:hypothetical protein
VGAKVPAGPNFPAGTDTGLAKRCVDNNTIISCAEQDSMEENGRNRAMGVPRLNGEFLGRFSKAEGQNIVNRGWF